MNTMNITKFRHFMKSFIAFIKDGTHNQADALRTFDYYQNTLLFNEEQYTNSQFESAILLLKKASAAIEER